LSLGGGILPGDLMLSRAGDDFILDFGSGDAIQITRPAWLDQPAFSPITLQIVGGDVRWFDLNATIADFMQLQAQDSGIVSWNAGDALAAHALGNSNDRAYGGRLAVDYARSGSLDAMPPDAIRAVISDADFGAVPQSMVTNHAPVANAGPDQTVGVGTTVYLSGALSLDVDGDTLEYRWTHERLAYYKLRYDEHSFLEGLDRSVRRRVERRFRERIALLPADAFTFRAPVVYARGDRPG